MTGFRLCRHTEALGVVPTRVEHHVPIARGDLVTTRHHNPSPRRPVNSIARAGAIALLFVLVSLLVMPTSALGQATGAPTPPAAAATPEPSATPRPIASLALSNASGLAGGTITANGSAFTPGETVDVTFNGQTVGSPTVNTGGSFSLSFSVPNVQPG